MRQKELSSYVGPYAPGEVPAPIVRYEPMAPVVQQNRHAVMLAAYAADPKRFVRGQPLVKGAPAAVWINPPLASTDLS